MIETEEGKNTHLGSGVRPHSTSSFSSPLEVGSRKPIATCGCETNVGIGLWATDLRLNAGAIKGELANPEFLCHHSLSESLGAECGTIPEALASPEGR